MKTYRNDDIIKSSLLFPMKIKIFIRHSIMGSFKERNEEKGAKFEISQQETSEVASWTSGVKI